MSREALLDRLMDRYNAQDVDAYAAMFTEDGCEGAYRGDVARQGRDGIRAGYAKVFAEFPQNRATVLEKFVYGDQIVVRADVGIIDVAWALKDQSTHEENRLVAERKRELKLLDDEFKDVLKESP